MTIEKDFPCDVTSNNDAAVIDVMSCEVVKHGEDHYQRRSSWGGSSIGSSVKKLKRFCPPHGWPIKYLTWALLLASLLGALWAIMPQQLSPHENVFDLVVTIILCFAAEQLVVKIPTPHGFPPIPPLFASLLMGLLLRNVPYPGNIAKDINTEVSSVLRKLALTVILTRAGLEIDPEAMKKVKWAMIRLAFSPCLAETILIGILAHFILGFPFLWSFMLGFVIAAVSPAVVVPCLILIQEKGYGVAKGIPSLVMAASGIDDVLAITGFTILLGLAIPSQTSSNFISMIEDLINPPSEQVTDPLNNDTFNWTTTASMMDGSDASEIGKEIAGVVIEIAVGILSGLLFGFFISYIPHKQMEYKNFCRGFLLLGIGVFMVFATELWQIAGAGTLCALVMSFTASLNWKEEAEPLAKAWHYMWLVFQPILFGLTGTLVDFRQMDGRTVGLGLLVLFLALIGRLMTSTAVTFGQNFTIKEKIFISISWIPKGTVQAALCSAAWEEAQTQNRPADEIEMGLQILILAVLITLITAPLGAFATSLAGPKLLSKDPPVRSSGKDNSAYDSSEECRSDCANSVIEMKTTEVQLYEVISDGKKTALNNETESTVF